MKGKRFEVTKVIAIVLSIALVIGLLPNSFLTAVAANEKMGTLSAITEGGVVTDAEKEEALVTYGGNVLTLNWAPANSEIGRVYDGWWVGIKMTAPANMTTEEDFENVSYQTGEGSNWSGNKSFWNAQDSAKDNPDTERFLTLWGMVNEELLNNAILSGKTIDYSWRFDWDKDGAFEQVAKLKIDPSKIILTKDGVQVYPATTSNGTVSVISDGLSVQGASNSNIVKVVYSSKATLTWCEKDTTVGRYNDGWWTGIKITAPAGMTTETDFANVNYQTRNGNTWSENKSFWNAQDSDKTNLDTERYLTMWGLLNESLLSGAVENGKNLTYSWRFDWNGDGVYEQVVLLEIAPEKITLNNQEGIQVYPELGQVSTITGGNVSGITGNVEVTVDEVTLTWSPKNEAIGRKQDGWWAGIKLTAPKGMTESQLEGVKYQKLIYGASEWSKDKSFWADKDSANGDAVHYVEIWMRLTPAMIRDAIEANENITNQYCFDWNQDGFFEQTVKFTVVPSDKIVLTKVEQTGFKFEKEAPEDQWVGAKYTNEATGGEGTGKVTYSVEEGTDIATVDATTGEVSFTAVGRVTIKAIKAADDTYAEATTTYSVTAVKRSQDEFKFATTGPVEITYEPDGTYTNKAAGGDGTGKVTYEIISGDCATVDENTGKVTIVKAGTVTVKASKAEDDLYHGKTIEYTLTVKKAQQVPIVISAPAEITYKTEKFEDLITYSGGSGNGQVSYEVVDGKDVATVETVNKKGTVNTLKAGVFQVKVTIADDGCYNAAEAFASIKVNHADQTTLKFEKEGTQKVTYNENGNKFINKAVDGESSSEQLIYSIISGGDCATIDAQTGEVTILKAGTVMIKAVKSGDACYNSAEIKYTLIIERANQTFSFADGKTVGKIYGVTKYLNKANEEKVSNAADGYGYGKQEIQYSIVEENNSIGATIDAKTGEITIGDSVGKVGKITVKAVKPQDDCYNEYSDTYELTVSYLDTPQEPYTFSTENKGNGDWYTGTVKIQAAPGYQISYDNEITTSDWDNYVEFDEEGINSTTVYLKNSDGSMTDAIDVKDIKIDTQNPTDLKISYREPLWSKGIFKTFDKTLEVTLSAKDTNSQIDFLTYNIGGEDIKVEKKDLIDGKDGTVTYKFQIMPQFRNTIKMSATDVSGRTTDLDDGKTLVVDDKNPTIKVSYEYKSGESKEYNNAIYTRLDTTAYFEIEEDNFDIASEPVVIVNDEVVDVQWGYDSKESVWKANYVLKGDGDYVVRVTFEDRSGNKMESYESKQIRIDNTLPTIDVTYEPEDENGYYATPCTVTVEVEEHNFLAENVKIAVSAKNVSDTSVATEATIAANYEAYLKNSSNWNKEGDVYTATLPIFDVDAQYSFTIDCKDIVGNDAKQYESPKPFVIDQTKPVNVNIEYSEPVNTWLQELARVITFGYYNPKQNKPLILKLTAEDETSGIDHFILEYFKEDNSSDVNEDDSVITILSEDLTYSEDKKTATYELEQGAQRRGSYRLTAYDRSANWQEMNHSDHIKVVDTISPTRRVKYSDAKQVVDATTLSTIKEFDYWGEDTNAILYYDAEMTMTFEVTEANFYKDEVVIKDNGEPKAPTDWVQNGDVWTGSIPIKEEGDHIVTMSYKDRSNNEMVTYTSKKIVIDKTAPKVRVDYHNEDVVNTLKDKDGNDRKYFDKTQTATITIEEHNFRADDVVLTVTAKNIIGEDIVVTDYLGQGKNRDEWKNLTPYETLWRRTDDTYKLEIEYPVDANYTFDIEYKDLAMRDSNEYAPDYFTVDKTKPTNLVATYSTNIIEKIISGITFGYYKEQMTVTIQADDEISQIHHFMYSYKKADNVSNVNAELLKQAIENAKISFNGEESKTSTAEFKIPKETLRNDNQFNGTIEFTAYDRAENSSAYEEKDKRIVVDNIAPTAQVSYNEPIQNANGISYYAGDINGTIVINEANFYAEDVKVIVTRDGQPVTVPVSWTDDSVDVHRGTFTLHEDGNYIVTIQYEDRSQNRMATYTSNQLTIDTKAPTISASNIKMNTANKDEVYGFTLTVNDENVDVKSIRPVLIAIVRNDEGTYETKEISLGEQREVEAGKTYTYTIDNLEQDGIYTLRCSVKDMSDHSTSTIGLSDGNQYEEVRFSINRHGSTFMVDDNTAEVIEKYYVYSVDNDVVIYEINADPIDTYSVKVNGKELKTTEFETSMSAKDGEWYKRTYALDKKLFEEEGEYSVVVESTDKANTMAYSDVKGLKISFVVDQTKPVLTISGIQNNGRYQVKEQTVTVIPTDDGGRLNSLKAVVLDKHGKAIKDEKGKDISVRFEMMGEELLKYLEEHEGKVTFTVPEGLENQVQVVCDDCAMNSAGTTNTFDETFEKVTVSQSKVVIFYANKPLFYGSIAGLLAVTGGGLFFILRKKKEN